MNYIGYLWLKIRLLLIGGRIHTAKKQVISGIQSSCNTTGNVERSYRQFLDLSVRREQLAVALRRMTRKNTNRPIPNVKIDTGCVSVSPGAQERLTDFDRETALARHRNGDWGEPSAQDWQHNNEAVRSGRGELLSRYPCHGGGFFLIETDLRIPKTQIRLERESV